MKRTILMALVLVLAGCQKEARATLAETYFPLNVGNSWTYTKGTDELTFTIIGTEEIDGHTYYIFNDHWNIFPPPPNGDGYEVTIGMETLFRYELAADTVIMRLQGSTIERIRYNFTGDEWNAGSPLGWCRLKESGVTCVVPAGEFSDCIKFELGQSYSHPDYYTYGEYLAPGVGTIKYVIPGSSSSEGDEVTFVLQSYTIIPEPSTLLLLGLGGLMLRKRK